MSISTCIYAGFTLCVWTVCNHKSQKAFRQPWNICWACHLIFPLLHAGHGLYSSISTLYQGSQQQGIILSCDILSTQSVLACKSTLVPTGQSQEISVGCLLRYVCITISTSKLQNGAPMCCDFVTCRLCTILVHYMRMCDHLQADWWYKNVTTLKICEIWIVRCKT